MPRKLMLALLILGLSAPLEAETILARDVPLSSIPTPYNWAHVSASGAGTSLALRAPVELLAPLGTEPGNAAVFFRNFLGGEKAWRDLEPQLLRHPEIGKYVPFDHPVLERVEVEIERASLRFYPDVLAYQGPATQIPNLLSMMTFGKTWLVRGKGTEDPAAAAADFRRTIRLGRLLRQDDVTVIQDLIGIALIRIGAEAMYELARANDDAKGMLVAELVMHDAQAIRLHTTTRMRSDLAALDKEWEGLPLTEMVFGVDVSDDDFAKLVDLSTRAGDRRFRLEGILGLRLLAEKGRLGIRKDARAELAKITSETKDPIIRVAARPMGD